MTRAIACGALIRCHCSIRVLGIPTRDAIRRQSLAVVIGKKDGTFRLRFGKFYNPNVGFESMFQT